MKSFIENQGTLKAVFTFKDFVEAIDFVNQVADLAIDLNHHPDISLHDYKKVTITTTTHDQGNVVTTKDWELANQIEAILQEK